MKKIYLTIISIFTTLLVFSQGDGVKSLTKDEADKIDNKVNKGINFGISLGFNSVFDNLYEARISPIDQRVMVNSIPKTSFLISTALSVPLTKGKLGGRYYRKLDEDGKEVGPVYYVPFGFCLIATINLVTFNSAATGTIFNQKIDGGLGIGYRINEDVQIALTYEMLSVRQPRDFLLNDETGFKNKPILINNQPLTSLGMDDNDYFRDRYMPSLSLKFIYLIRGDKTKD